MSLVEFSYSEYEGESRYWDISNASFIDTNLIVGKNSSGKSRLMSVIAAFTRLLAGKQQIPHEQCNFSAKIQLDSREFFYEVKFKNGEVISEILRIEGMEKNALERTENGSGEIYYETTNSFLNFKLPQDGLAVVLKRDEIQHPFLVELHKWADSVALYLFGSDFGKSNFMASIDSQIFFNNPAPPLFDDPNNLVAVYSSAFIKFGDDFDKAIICDMNFLGYSLTDIGSGNLQSMINFPFPAVGLFTVERDLKFQNPQMQMSQGMFRALAIIINLNVCAFAKNKKLILIDDIGEGLDYERAVKIIDLLIKKSQDNDIQLIMTSNDRFVMNKVPLEYWSVIKRTGGIVKTFNPRNSPDQFEDFKYIGLNNFDFFASNFFEAEVNDD